ncbi:hypothetical protein ES703_32095 [subsurface metagenome]
MTQDERTKGQNTKQGEVSESQEAPATLEDMLKELPIAEKYKPLLTNLVTGILQSIVQVNERMAALENKPAVQDAPGAFEGLDAEQRYKILMARASAPAAQAQMELAKGLLTGVRGNSGGGLDDLVKSAEKLQSLKMLLIPEPSPLQVVMEKAQIQQTLAQTRLMNKVVGREANQYLDKLEASLSGEE